MDPWWNLDLLPLEQRREDGDQDRRADDQKVRTSSLAVCRIPYMAVTAERTAGLLLRPPRLHERDAAVRWTVGNFAQR